MACVRPFLIENPNEKARKWYRYIEVPCGWCLNCRVDKRNFLEDSCKHYFEKMKGVGSFTLLTYNDFQNTRNLVTSPSDGKLRYSLCYKDFQDFMKRLRMYLERNKLYNGTTLRSDFKYLVVGEYGHNAKSGLDRNHFHVIFLGLDYNALRPILQKLWRNGYVYNRPIKAGAFRYVLKYMDKQVVGDEAKILYDDNGIERPRHYTSKGLATEWLLSQVEFLRTHNGCYPTSKAGKYRPVSTYWKNKLQLRTSNDETYKQLAISMLSSHQMRNINIGKKYNEYPIPKYHHYSLKEINDYKHKMALKRERELINEARKDGLYCHYTFDDLPEVQDFSHLVCDALDPIPF